MIEIRFAVFYQYDGPTHTNPLGNKLSHEDVVDRLGLLEGDFLHVLDEDAKIKVTSEDYKNEQIEMLIQSDCSEEKLLSVIEDILKENQLRGKIIKPPTSG